MLGIFVGILLSQEIDLRIIEIYEKDFSLKLYGGIF